MKVYIDAIIYNLQKSGGISVYFYELIKRMLIDDLDVNLIETDAENQNIFRNKLSVPANRILKEKYYFFKRYLDLKLKLEKGSVLHSSYYRFTHCKDVVNIITIYDFTYELYMAGIQKWMHSFQKKRAINNADGIICISESTKNDLLKLHPNVNPAKIAVIYLAASEEFRKLDKTPSGELDSQIGSFLSEKYILFVGTREKYKNFDLAVAAVVKLASFKFILVGGGALSEAERELLETSLPGRYLHLNGISSRTLNVLYNNAFCFLYPSSYEGFGIPILEAMQAGCPVVTTNKASIPEVCGNAGLAVSNPSADSFADHILLLVDETFRKSVVAEGYKQASKFSWDETYRQTVAFYKKISNNKAAMLRQ